MGHGRQNGKNANTRELKRLGGLLRDLRKKNHLTLHQLGKKTQFSTGYLSQVERGMNSPTVSAFKKIAVALHVDLMYFFDRSNSRTSYVVRKGQRKTVGNPKTKVVYELLKPVEFSGMLEPLLIRFLPGANSETKAYTHLGEECLYVLEGRLRFFLDKETYDLNEGDSIWYPAMIKHGWENPFNETAFVIKVTTPPSF